MCVQRSRGHRRTDSTVSLEPLSPVTTPFCSSPVFPSPEEVRRISVTSPTDRRPWRDEQPLVSVSIKTKHVSLTACKIKIVIMKTGMLTPAEHLNGGYEHCKRHCRKYEGGGSQIRLRRCTGGQQVSFLLITSCTSDWYTRSHKWLILYALRCTFSGS